MGFDREEETVSHAVTNYDPAAEAAAIAAERIKNERPCSSCGRPPSQTRFYPSRTDKCVECIKARRNARTAESPKSYTDLDPVVSSEIDAQPELHVEEQDPVSAPAASCTCRECGVSFEAYRNGVAVVINYCQDCMKKRLKRGIRKAGDLAAPNFKIVLDLEQDPEIFEALTRASRSERRTLDNQAIVILEQALRGRPMKGAASCGE